MVRLMADAIGRTTDDTHVFGVVVNRLGGRAIIPEAADRRYCEFYPGEPLAALRVILTRRALGRRRLRPATLKSR